MPQTAPPPLSANALTRVLAVSRLNGWGVAGFAALCALAALVQLDWPNAAWALLATAAGALELHGRRRLQRADPLGMRGLMMAQFFLMGVIWLYAWFRWRYFNPDVLWAEIPGYAQAQVLLELEKAGLDPERDRPLFLGLLNIAVCITLALVSLVYQGGLAIYYAVKSAAVRRALAGLPSPEPPPVG